MEAFWTFEIGSHKLSTQYISSYAGNEYLAKIMNFSGIDMNCNIGGGYLLSPSEVSFNIDNSSEIYTKADFENKYCIITLVVNSTVSRQWKMKIKSLVSAYNVFYVQAKDLLQDILDGEFPNTAHPMEAFPVEMHEEEETEDYDNYRIPITYGEAYIPLSWGYYEDDAKGYYILGTGASEYEVLKVKSPSSDLVWEAEDGRSFEEYVKTGADGKDYHVADFNIVAGEGDTFDPGKWPTGQKPKVHYRSTSPEHNPANIIKDVLLSFGALSEDIDLVSFNAAADFYDDEANGKKIEWNAAFYTKQSKEQILLNLQRQCDAYLYVEDKIKIMPFSSTPIETFDRSKVKAKSLKTSNYDVKKSDSGTVKWAEDGTPQDILQGRKKVSVVSGGTTNNPDTETLELNFITDSVIAQKIAKAYFEKKLLKKELVSFDTSGAVIDTLNTICPASMITLNDAIFGGEKTMLLNRVSIKKDLTISLSGYVYDTLDEFYTITAEPVTIPRDIVPSNVFMLEGDFSTATIFLYKRENIAEEIVLTSASPNASVEANSTANIYGISSNSIFYIDEKTHVQIFHATGENAININSYSTLFSINRSGSVISLEGADGTRLKVPATNNNQIINFTDLSNLVLKIENNTVKLNEATITTNKKYFPGINESIIEVLTDLSPNYEVPVNRHAIVYGTEVVNEITLNTGSKVELINTGGNNIFNIPIASTEVTFVRFGLAVTMYEPGGIVIKIPATLDGQSFVFTDKTSVLRIINKVPTMDGIPIANTESGGRPDRPSQPSTYYFSTGLLVGQNNGWTQEIPDNGDDTLWVTSATAFAFSKALSDVIPENEWADPTILSKKDLESVNHTVIYLYKRTNAVPETTDISDPVVYNFSTGILSGSIGEWSTDIPAGNDPLYVTHAVALNALNYDEIANSEWSTPVIMAQNGHTMVTLYKREASALIATLSVETPNMTVNPNETWKIYGTSGQNEITIASGSVVDLINFAGNNIINIQSNFSLFNFSRSGTTVTFSGYDGTVLKIPATASDQTINFTDLTTNNTLKITDEQVLFGTEAVSTEKKYYPGFGTGAIEVLTEASPDHTALANEHTTIYCTSVPNEITLSIGSKVDLISNSGENIINFPQDYVEVSVSRTGSIVNIRHDSGTVLNIPATTVEQTINFTDMSTILQIVENTIVLNSNSIDYTPSGKVPSLPTTEVTYLHDSGLTINQDNGWYQEPPTGDEELWTITALTKGTISPENWSQPLLITHKGEDGAPGEDAEEITTEDLLSKLAGSITEDELYGDLTARIDLIDTEFTWTNDIFESDTWAGVTALFPDVMGYSQTIRDDLDNNISVTTALQTNVENNYATLVYVDSVESSIYGATVSSFTQINAEFDSVDSALSSKASITQLNNAKSDIYGSSVSSFTYIDSKFDSVDAAISNRATITYVDSTFTTDAEAQAIASARIEAEVEGSYATITEFNLVEASVDIAKAQRTVKVESNGHIVGLSMIAGGTGDDLSTFTVHADKFQIVSSSSSTTLNTPFTVGTVNGNSSVGIDGNLIIDGSILARSVDVDDLFAQTITVKTGGYIRSEDYTSSTGWEINPDGSATFENVTVRGKLDGVIIDSTDGLVVDSANGIVVNDGASIVLNGIGSVIDFDEGFLYCGSASFKIFSKPGAWLELHGEYGLDLSAGTGYNVTCYEDIVPDTTNARDLGTSLKHWGTTYTSALNFGDEDLDRYEVGIYTPTLKYGTTSVSLNSSNNLLAYTIIGSKITISGRLRLGTVSSPTGGVTFSLPTIAAVESQTSDAEYYVGTVLHSGMETFTDTGNLICAYYSTTYATIYEQTSTGAAAIGDKLKTDAYLYISFTYFTP